MNKTALYCVICKQLIAPHDWGTDVEYAKKAVYHKSFGAAHVRHVGVEEEFQRLMGKEEGNDQGQTQEVQ